MVLPQICYFCGGEITKRGRDGGSLLIHSLDGNHNNWDPENKVSTHKKCHAEHHAKNPLLGEEYRDHTRGQIEISQFVKSKLDDLKEKEEHKSYDSAIRSLLNHLEKVGK